jgi:carbamoyl-phosphate synthase large subunit
MIRGRIRYHERLVKQTVLVLGSGPIRIGQGIEFDYSCVHCVWALREMGYRAIIVNNNPETVSTDFDTGDGLYFEPVTLEDVLDVVAHESPVGVVTQFGGQTAINLAEPLARAGVPILGTSPESIALAEDRDLFEQLLARLNVPKPDGRAVRSYEDARRVAEEIGYPVLVRPSFVLGGRAMEIVYSPNHLEHFFAEALAANPGQPVLVDKYLRGQEAEVDVISDGIDTLVPGIMEHIERAGVHSGDSMAVYPPVSLGRDVECRIVEVACALARELGVRGLMNIQFVIEGGEVFVLEVNPRASRTVPYLSKVTGVPMVQLATRTMMGERLADLGYGSGLWQPGGGAARWAPGPAHAPRGIGRIVSADEWRTAKAEPPLFAVKAPVFSFQKLTRVEPSLGPEMKSTGEVLGIDPTYEGALYKALIASGIRFRGDGHVLLSVDDPDKTAAVEIARRLVEQGYRLAATPGTHRALTEAGLEAKVARKIRDGSPNLIDLIRDGEVSLLINTPSPDENAEQEGARIRRACIEVGIACVTSIDTARAIAHALRVYADPSLAECRPYTEYLAR